MNPTVLMAVWGRRHLVEINLRLLSQQHCQIVCVASLQEDFDFLRGLKLPHLQIVPAPNNPLGKKWQSGVDQCRILNADPLIILGSDDFLDQNFISNACKLSRNLDFVCFDKWWIYSPFDKKSYSLQYKNKFPLGSGRIFRKEYLDRKSWQLYDTSLNIKLDDFAWENIEGRDGILFNPNGLNLLAVKGNWEVLNPLDRILSADTINWSYEKDIDSRFNYSISIHELFKGF